MTRVIWDLNDTLEKSLEKYKNEDGSIEIFPTIKRYRRRRKEITITDIRNPLNTFWTAHEEYMRQAPENPKILFVGMNPSPDSPMGIPFLSDEGYSDFLQSKGIPIYDARSSESGRRFQRLLQYMFHNGYENQTETYEKIHRHCAVINYCPLVFTNSNGNNVSLDGFNKSNHPLLIDLMEHCDHALEDTIEILQPELSIGVGWYAYYRVVATDSQAPHMYIPHPSPFPDNTYEDWFGRVMSIDERYMAMWKDIISEINQEEGYGRY